MGPCVSTCVGTGFKSCVRADAGTSFGFGKGNCFGVFNGAGTGVGTGGGTDVCPGDGGVGPVGEGVQVEHEGPVGVDGQHVHRCWRTEWPPLNKKDSPTKFFLNRQLLF